jgi:hypothetical protein
MHDAELRCREPTPIASRMIAIIRSRLALELRAE